MLLQEQNKPNSNIQMISKEEFASRRKKVLEYLKDLSQKQGKNLKAVFKSGRQKTFSNDVHYPFRVNSDFYYLTGFTEADSVCVLDPHADRPFTLYVQPMDPMYTIWEGHREGLKGALENFNADAAYEADDFNDTTYPNSNKKASQTHDITDFVHSLRSVKSEAEISVMRKAAAISVQAHRVIKDEIFPGAFEYEVEAKINHVFRSQGASGWAYPAIVAAGADTCVLHYTTNHKQIQKGDLVLVDAGCEYQYYASDITRTFSAGEMSQEQQDVYDIVLAAQKAAIDSVKPGNSFQDTHDITCKIIGEGLAELKYIKDKNDPAQIKQYYMHGTGHSLGIDVHDVGIDKKSTKYVPGMVTTIEPGIYIREKAIGIRIEDDVLVTNNAFDVLTEGLEK